MDNPRLDPRAARVVAWHNRHPLARRITAAQVQGIGHVAVPFFAADAPVATAMPRPRELATAVIGQAQASAAATLGQTTDGTAEGASLRERAAARAKQAAETAALAGAGDDTDTVLIDAVPDSDPATPAVLPAAPASEVAAPASKAPATKPGRLRAAFVENFIAPISRRAAARFIARHGVPHAAPPADGPVREVAVARSSPGETVVWLYAGTAAIEDGARRVRVLLAPGPAGAVLGPRLYDRRRIAALCAVLLGLTAAVAYVLRPQPPQPAAQPLAAAIAASASAAASAAAALAPVPASLPASASAAASASASASAPAPALASAPASASAPPSASAPALVLQPTPPLSTPPPAAAAAAEPVPAPEPVTQTSAAAAPAAAPAPAIVTTTRMRPELRPPLDDTSKAAARQAVADLRATLPPAPARPPAPVPTPPPAANSAQTAAAIAAARQPLFALTSRVLRTAAESEQLAIAARALLAQPAAKGLPVQVELMPAGADWRVVAWPFNSAADAERARAMLASRGLRVQVVGF